WTNFTNSHNSSLLSGIEMQELKKPLAKIDLVTFSECGAPMQRHSNPLAIHHAGVWLNRDNLLPVTGHQNLCLSLGLMVSSLYPKPPFFSHFAPLLRIFLAHERIFFGIKVKFPEIFLGYQS